ncbi:hypothetical protein [Streptomyces decoyicus]|uniref:hypothetical protein n=1 Tax=Streptomyces decoyicus TaxID=249567 RepID=UPI003824C114
MTDDLYAHYMRAHQALRPHRETCSGCTDTFRCAAGERLYEGFARLQDAHLNRRRRRCSP